MRPRNRWGSIYFGILLMLLGAGFLLQRLGVWPEWAWMSNWWTLIVVALGAAHLVHPQRANDVGNGVMLLLMGVWMMIASSGWHGFSWRNSWPLALVAMGAGVVAHEIAARWLPDFRRSRNGERHA